MSLRALALDWSFDGPVGTGFLAVVLAAGALYLTAAAHGRQHDRRRRRWPLRRTALFLGGLAALVVDLYSGIGTEADVRLSVHMVEHMVMLVVVAPLLAAGAPVRLAFFALPRDGRRRLARWLHSRAASALTRPNVTMVTFSGVLLLSHFPAVYELTLRNDYVHEIEHGLYLFTAVLMWASILGVDPLPHRASARGELACMVGCMLPMALIALWLEPRATRSTATTSGCSAVRRSTTSGSRQQSCGSAGCRRLRCRRWRACTSWPVIEHSSRRSEPATA